jgi:hypothetical protein
MKIKKIKAQDLDQLNIPERRKNRIIRGNLKVFSITDDENEIIANGFINGMKPIGRVINIEYKKENLNKIEILSLILEEASKYFSFVLYVSYEDLQVSDPIKRKNGIDIDNSPIFIYYI